MTGGGGSASAQNNEGDGRSGWREERAHTLSLQGGSSKPAAAVAHCGAVIEWIYALMLVICLSEISVVL
jgi:hypothetical protein